MTAARRLKLSYDEYLALEQRTGQKYEYKDGEAWPLWPAEEGEGAVAMAGGTPAHAQLSARMIRALGRLVEGGPCDVYSSDLKLRVLATGLSTFADAVVVCGPREAPPDDKNAVTNPTLIVEVLSDSTETWDRGEKFRDYRRMPSLRAYVLVSQHEPRIEAFTRDGERWTFCEGEAGESVYLPCLGGDLAVDAVYDGVALE